MLISPSTATNLKLKLATFDCVTLFIVTRETQIQNLVSLKIKQQFAILHSLPSVCIYSLRLSLIELMDVRSTYRTKRVLLFLYVEHHIRKYVRLRHRTVSLYYRMRQKWVRRVMHTGFSRGNLKERDLLEDLGVS